MGQTSPLVRGCALCPLSLVAALLCACDANVDGPATETLDPEAQNQGTGHADSTPESESESESGQGLSQLSFRLEWNLDQVEFLNGGGFQLLNNTGYQVQIQQGYLVNYSISLIPCSDEATLGMGVDLRHPQTDQSLRRRGDEVDIDPSTIGAPLVEKLTQPSPVTSTPQTIPPQLYCGMHYLLARGDEKTPNMPTDVDLMRKSLYLAGSYKKQGEDTWTEFETAVDIAAADIFVVGNDLANVELDSATIVLTRRLAGAFDDIEFATFDNKSIGRQVLENLVAPAQLSVAIEAVDR